MNTNEENSIAIIGFSGRFPGARSLDEFWQNLVQGREVTTRFSREELIAAQVEPSTYEDPHYVPVRGILKDIDMFDADFFSFTPKEAQIADPQQRLMLECAWEALEHAGYAPSHYKGIIGVFVGSSMNTYLLNNILPNPEVMATSGPLSVTIGNETGQLAMRIAYKLNLRGAAVTIQTACSTSLVAIHMACQNLLLGEVDLALAGGVSISIPQHAGHTYTPNGIYSIDGHCRAFDTDARGAIAGNGAGVVVLKRTHEAIADNDTIYAVIRGSAINNDGTQKIGYTAPSMQGQAQVIANAHLIAGTPPDTISYVEAHGTGTELGDPIEVAALTEAFRAGHWSRGRCLLGSLKPNIGHLDAAAGVASLIKCILALQHEQLPPNINFTRPNPQIPFEQSPFFVHTEPHPWPVTDQPRRCGISSFGIGGTNAHLILQEAPDVVHRTQVDKPELILLSAKTPTALTTMANNLSRYVQDHPELKIGDMAYTLQTGRTEFPYRQAFVCQSQKELLNQLMAHNEIIASKNNQTFTIVFMYPGQGSQYSGMAQELYQQYAIFRESIDQSAQQVQTLIGFDLRPLICGDPSRENDLLLEETQTAQVALFIVEYALTQLLEHWGLRPQTVIGHSFGEYTAACIAGALSFSDALRLIAERGRLMAQTPHGAMLAIRATEEEIRTYLPFHNIVVTAHNGPRSIVVAGETEAIEQLARQLQDAGIASQRLAVSHAFHSPSMESIIPAFEQFAASIPFQPLQLPLASNIGGHICERGTVLTASYWAQHLCELVAFRAGIEHLASMHDVLFVEVGPGKSLTTLTRQTVYGQQIPVIPVLPNHEVPGTRSFLDALGQLWSNGVSVNWNTEAGSTLQRIALPTYPFERKRYWIDPPQQRTTAATSGLTVASQEQRTTLSEVERIAEPIVQKQQEQQATSNDEQRSEIALEIAAIWSTLLGIEHIPTDAKFFGIGGDSLSAVQMLTRIREAFSVDITLRDIFKHSTPEGIAGIVLDALLAAELTMNGAKA